MNHEALIHTPLFEAPPPQYSYIEIEAARRGKRPGSEDRSKKFYDGKKPKKPTNPLGIPVSRETAINRGVIKRSQRRSMRPD